MVKSNLFFIKGDLWLELLVQIQVSIFIRYNFSTTYIELG